MATYKTDNANWSRYVTLNQYNANILGVPFPKTNYYQIVPQYAGFDYNTPNYDRLTNGSANNYTTVSAAYADPNVVQVNYVKRNCQ